MKKVSILQKLQDYAISLVNDIVWVVSAVLPIFVTLAIVGFMVIKGPEMHNKWLRSKVGSKVYYVRGGPRGGGGTGFAITAPSGTTYIMTNEHVCSGVENSSGIKDSVYIADESGNGLRRRIIAKDDYSDLCLIEGIPGVQGLSLASSAPQPGDVIGVIGHPRLMPLLLSRGEMMGREDVAILEGVIAIKGRDGWSQIPKEDGGTLESECAKPKQQIVETTIPIFVFRIDAKVCVNVTKQAYITNVVILGGNSGSPVVNFWGQVNGVAFAADSSNNWGRMVSLEDVKAFLKQY